jgi:hypothetical protein
MKTVSMETVFKLQHAETCASNKRAHDALTAPPLHATLERSSHTSPLSLVRAIC